MVVSFFFAMERLTAYRVFTNRRDVGCRDLIKGTGGDLVVQKLICDVERVGQFRSADHRSI
jgi:hypothetical protein